MNFAESQPTPKALADPKPEALAPASPWSDPPPEPNTQDLQAELVALVRQQLAAGGLGERDSNRLRHLTSLVGPRMVSDIRSQALGQFVERNQRGQPDAAAVAAWEERQRSFNPLQNRRQAVRNAIASVPLKVALGKLDVEEREATRTALETIRADFQERRLEVQRAFNRGELR